MAEQYSVEAILKAVGADQFSKAFKNATKDVVGLGNSTNKANLTIGKLAAAVGITAAVAKGFNQIKSAVDGAISRYDTLNNFPKILQMMGFSAQDSEKAINRLSDGIQGLPTTLDSVASTAQRIAIMTGDLDGAVETTLALNNAFIASGSSTADAQRGLEQYVQMLAKGEVDLQSWRSLQETMGVALNKTAEAFGYTGTSAQNDLYDALKAGHITFDEFNAKLIELSNETGGFADIAREASGGIRTAWTNMNTAIVRGVTNVIEAIDKMLADTPFESIENIITTVGKKFFDFLNGIAQAIPVAAEKIKSFKEALEPWIPTIQNVITAIMSAVVVVAVLNTIRNGFVLLGTAIAFLTSPIGIVMAALALFAYKIINLWQTNEGFRDSVMTAWGNIQSYIQSIVPVIAEKIRSVVDALEPWVPMIQNVIAAVASMIVIVNVLSIVQGGFTKLGAAIAFLTSPIGIAMVAVAALTAVITHLWQTNESFRSNVSVLWESVKTIISTAFQTILPHAMNFISALLLLVQAMMPVVVWAVNAAVAFVTWIAELLATHTWIVQLVTIVVAAIGVIKVIIAVVSAVSTVFTIAATAIKIFGAIIALIASPIGIVIAGIAALVAAIVYLYNKVEWVHNLLSPIVEGAKSLWGGFLDLIGLGTKEAADTAADSISGLAETTGAKTAEMSETTQSNVGSMTEGIGFDLNNMSLNGIADFQALNSGASSETSMMMGNVTGDMSMMHTNSATEMFGMNTDVLSAFDSMNAGASLDAATMNTNVSNEASQMSSNVTNEVGNMGYMAIADVGAMSGDVTGEVSSMSSTVQSDVGSMTGFVTGDVSDMLSAVTGDVSGMSSDVLADFSFMNQGATGDFDAMTSAIMADSSSLDSQVSTDFSSMNSSVQSEMSNIESSTTSKMSNVNRNFGSSLKSMVKVMSSELKAMVSATKSGMGQLVSAFSSGMSRSANVLRSGMSTILSALRSYAGQMNAAGAYLMQGFASGINSKGAVAVNNANRIANRVAATMRKALAIHSPSRVTEEIGEFSGEGLGIGLGNMIRYVSRIAKRLGLAAVPDLEEVDIAGHVNQINRQASAQMQNLVTSEMTVEKQPAHVVVRIGNSEFATFVDDITKNQMRTVNRQRHRGV